MKDFGFQITIVAPTQLIAVCAMDLKSSQLRLQVPSTDLIEPGIGPISSVQSEEVGIHKNPRHGDDASVPTWLAARNASRVLFLSMAFTSRAIIAGLMKLDSTLKRKWCHHRSLL